MNFFRRFYAGPTGAAVDKQAGRRQSRGNLERGGIIRIDPLRGVALSFLGILLLAALASGQNPLPSGNLYGTALDPEGKSVPGVTVELRGPGAPQSAITDRTGDFRFLYLSPGTYSLTLERTGFAQVSRDVDVALGQNAVLTVTLPVAGAEEAVTVSGESSALDSRETETGATFERKELDTIPTTRDPWAILRQVPGVLVASMNVNGSDTGTQSVFVGKGSHADQNTYNLDGVAINISYFDFDSLGDIEVVTGGSDPALATPGVALNLVTRRGTNELKGSGRGYYFFPSSVGSSDQVPSDGGYDYGLEAGGPLWKDRLWLWGAYARNAVPGQTFFLPEGEPVRRTSHLEHWNAKLNAQPAPANSLTLFYLHFDKLVDGRGADPYRSQESTWNQTTPTAVYKIEDSHVLSEKLFASIYLSHVSGEFTLTPEGGRDPQVNIDMAGVVRNSNLFYQSRFPQNQAGLTASGFFDTGDLQHELKFGFGYRHSSFDSTTSWPGDQIIGNEYSMLAKVTRTAKLKYEMNYYDAYLRDTIQTGNLTVNVGLRFDYQQGRNLPSAVSANPVYPDLLPAVQYSGDSGYPITWRLIQPRVGATYALGPDRKTLVRASYSRFANQLNDQIFFINAFPGPAYLYYSWQDTNGNHHVDRDEVDTCRECLQYALGVDPDNPGSTASVNRISPNFEPPTTDEFIVGVEREIFSDLSASLAYTHRSSRNQEFPFPRPLVGVTSDDYQYLGNAIGSVTDANGFTLRFDEPYYGLTMCPPPCSGFVTENRPDYSDSYDGLELQIIKRLSHGWSLRAGFGYNNWRKNVGPGAIVDPNNLLGGSNASGANTGDAFSRFGTVFINSKWQFNVSSMVQLPMGINIAANFFGRQGFVLPYFVNVLTHDTNASSPDIQIGQVDSYRLPDVYQLDLRIEKLLRIGSRVTVTPSLDCFNVADSHTVLGRDGFVGSWDHGADEPFSPADQFNAVSERLSDRTFRVGVRVSF